MDSERNKCVQKLLFVLGIAAIVVGFLFGFAEAEEDQMQWAIICGLALILLSMINEFERIKFGKEGTELIRRAESKIDELKKLEQDMTYSIGKTFYDTVTSMKRKRGLDDFGVWILGAFNFLSKVNSEASSQLISELIETTGHDLLDVQFMATRDTLNKNTEQLRRIEKELYSQGDVRGKLSEKLGRLISSLSNPEMQQ